MSFTITRPAPVDGEAVLPIVDAKAHLRVLHDDEDPLIEALRDAAIDWVERYCSVSLGVRSYVWHGSGLCDAVMLPIGPVVAVQSVNYLDTAGVSAALVSTDWRLAGNRLMSAPGKSWPATLSGAGAVSVAFTAGFADPATDARALVAAVKMLMGNLYKFREDAISGTIVSEVPMGVTALCSGYRMPVIG
jgi:uncharacterized phiE125 gp8 family phage protein